MIDIPSITGIDGYWTDRHELAMGTTAQFVVGDAPDGVVDWAVEELERLEQCWSRFRPSSELCALNANAGTWTDVSPRMLLVLTCAADLHRATGGRFDPTILDALEGAGYDRSFEQVRAASDATAAYAPEPAPGSRSRSTSTSRACAFERGRGSTSAGSARAWPPTCSRADSSTGVRAPRSSVSAATCAPGARRHPTGRGTFPSSIRATATRPRSVWPLTDGAIVTSSMRIRAWTRAGQRHHHLIDPATGDSARTGIAAVVAAARDAWWAEGIAKSIVVAGLDEGRALASAHGVHAWIYLDDSTMVDTGGKELPGMIAEVSQKFTWYVARASGLVAWAIVTASIVWGLVLSTRIIRRKGIPAWLLDLHKFLGTLSVVFVAVHLLALWADNFLYFGPANCSYRWRRPVTVRFRRRGAWSRCICCSRSRSRRG